MQFIIISKKQNKSFFIFLDIFNFLLHLTINRTSNIGASTYVSFIRSLCHYLYYYYIYIDIKQKYYLNQGQWNCKYYLYHKNSLSILHHTRCHTDQSRGYSNHRLYNILHTADYSWYRTILFHILCTRNKKTKNKKQTKKVKRKVMHYV